MSIGKKFIISLLHTPLTTTRMLIVSLTNNDAMVEISIVQMVSRHIGDIIDHGKKTSEWRNVIHFFSNCL